MVATAESTNERQLQWMTDLRALVAQVHEWCNARGWASQVSDKVIKESSLGDYAAPMLQVRTPDGATIYLEPVARDVAGAEGLVDIYAWPSLRRLLLKRQTGQWRVNTDSGVPLPTPWSEPVFVELVHALTSPA